MAPVGPSGFQGDARVLWERQYPSMLGQYYGILQESLRSLRSCCVCVQSTDRGSVGVSANSVGVVAERNDRCGGELDVVVREPSVGGGERVGTCVGSPGASEDDENLGAGCGTPAGEVAEENDGCSSVGARADLGRRSILGSATATECVRGCGDLSQALPSGELRAEELGGCGLLRVSQSSERQGGTAEVVRGKNNERNRLARQRRKKAQDGAVKMQLGILAGCDEQTLEGLQRSKAACMSSYLTLRTMENERKIDRMRAEEAVTCGVKEQEKFKKKTKTSRVSEKFDPVLDKMQEEMYSYVMAIENEEVDRYGVPAVQAKMALLKRKIDRHLNR